MSTPEERLAARGVTVRNDRSGTTLIVRGSTVVVDADADHSLDGRQHGGDTGSKLTGANDPETP